MGNVVSLVSEPDFGDGDDDDGYLILACPECDNTEWNITPDALFVCAACEEVLGLSDMFVKN